MPMGGGQPAQTTQTTKVELPGWVERASKDNYQFARHVANRPFKQWEGERLADRSAFTDASYDRLRANLGSTNKYYNQAEGSLDRARAAYGQGIGMLNQSQPYYGKAAGEFDKASGMVDQAAPLYGEAADIFRGTAGPLDINKYLNPYTEEVEKRAIGNAGTALTQQLAQQKGEAAKNSVFGGTRFGVQQGVTSAEGARGIGDLSAMLRKAGIDFATTTGLQDRAGIRDSATGLLNTAAGRLNAAGQYGAAGSGYLDTAGSMQNAAAGYGNIGGGLTQTGQGYLNTAQTRGMQNAADVASLSAAGQEQQAQRQAVYDMRMGKWGEKRNYPLEQLNIKLAALGMSPYGKTETMQKTSTSEQPPFDWATFGLGALKTIPSFFAMSDRNMKTDIEKLTGGPIPLYAYRYKGDPKSYPKVVGPMAQDVEKVVPSAVKKVGGKRVVNLSNLMEVLS